MLARILPFLKCSGCSGEFSFLDGGVKCVSCGQIFIKKNDALVFVKTPPEKDKDTSLTFKLKEFLRKRPKLFFTLYYTLGVFTGKSAKKAIKDLPRDSLILNIASGIKIIRSDVVNIDIEPYRGVLVAADALNLPFKDGVADAVICESSLEHFPRPESAVAEMRRVLKRGGMVYASLPFIVGFHASPHDYYRWTEAGARELFKDFEAKEVGVYWGPTYALTWILREWLAVVLSFNSKILHQILVLFFTLLFAPLNFLDYIFSRFKLAKNIAFGFYFIGTKK